VGAQIVIRQIAAELLIVAAIGFALAALGPFGSYLLPLGSRCLLWAGGAMIAYGIIRPAIPAGDRLAAKLRTPGLLAYALMLAIASVPITLLLSASLEAWSVRPSWTGGTAFLYFQVWLIGLAIWLFMKRIGLRVPVAGPTEAEANHPVADPLPRPRLLRRLPASFGDTVLCLQMEDHYVRVHGKTGSALLLLRMSDAVAELDGVEGMQVHRSWWIARGDVARIRRDNRTLRIELENGVTVPVARPYAAALKDTPWGKLATE
jgi:hypothetical protein